jgi:hypothetical protein
LLEQAVEEMKRELICAAAVSSERAALQDEVALRALAAMNQISHGAPVAGCIVAWPPNASLSGDQTAAAARRRTRAIGARAQASARLRVVLRRGP